MDANGQPGMRIRPVRVDRFVEAVLSGHDDEFDMILAFDPILATMDAVGTASLLKALVESRLRSGAGQLVLGARSDGVTVEFALWDDGRPGRFSSHISFLARVIGAQAFGRTEDGGVGITVTLGAAAVAAAA